MHFLRLIAFVVVAVWSQLHASPEFYEGIASAQFFESSQGHMLRYTRFETSVKEKKGDVVFIQGRGTFLEFYEVLIDPLLDRGYDVWMYDLTGQGASSRLAIGKETTELTAQRMQHIDSFEKYVFDVQDFVQRVVIPEVNRGTLLLGGYSTGAHIAFRYLQVYPRHPFQGMFAISPLVSLKIPVPHNLFLGTLNGMALVKDMRSYVKAGDVDPIYEMAFSTNPYTSEAERFQEMQRLCLENTPWMMGGVSWSWLRAATESVLALWEEEALQSIQIPVLISTAGEDGVVDVSYNEQFAQSLPTSKNIFYPKGRHELFRETNSIREDWWQEFDAYFK